MKNKPSKQTHTGLRVLLVDAAPDRGVMLQDALLEAGCAIAAHVSSALDLPRLVGEIQPDILVCDVVRLEPDTLEQLCLISRDQPLPVVVFTDDRDQNKIHDAIRSGISAYVVDGLERARIWPIVEVAIARFEAFEGMRRELEKAENQLAERKLLDRAKGILMKQRGWSEDEAYQAMRKSAMAKGLRVSDVAGHIISAAELLM